MEPDTSRPNTHLDKHQIQYKKKPAFITSMAAAVQKRLKTNSENSQNSRLSIHNIKRGMSASVSTVQKPHLMLESDSSMSLLEKWKEEKEKKKREAAAKKLKPFVAGVADLSKIVQVLPPIKKLKPVPSTSGVRGVVTHSQAAKNKIIDKSNEISFAPKNFTFKPPLLNISNVPVLAPVSTRKGKINFTFKPVLPSSKVPEKSSTSDKTRILKNKMDIGKVKSDRDSSRTTRASKYSAQSSSSGESVDISRNKSRVPIQSSLSSESEVEFQPVVKTEKTSANSIFKKHLSPKREPWSEENLLKNTEPLSPPAKTSEEIKKTNPCVTLSRGMDSSQWEKKTESPFSEEKRFRCPTASPSLVYFIDTQSEDKIDDNDN